jgi:hypothetical protein
MIDLFLQIATYLGIFTFGFTSGIIFSTLVLLKKIKNYTLVKKSS